MAVAALVLGIVSIPTCFCYGCPSLICGALACIFGGMILSQIKQGQAPETAKGISIAGIACGAVGIVCSGLFWVMGILGVVIGEM